MSDQNKVMDPAPELGSKKFRKTRDYFGKRKYSENGGSAGSVFDEETSSDSGVSNAETVQKKDQRSSTPDSVTSGVSSDSSPIAALKPQVPLKQRQKVIRLEEAKLKEEEIKLEQPSTSGGELKISAVETVTAGPSWRNDNYKENTNPTQEELDYYKEMASKRWESDLKRLRKLFEKDCGFKHKLEVKPEVEVEPRQNVTVEVKRGARASTSAAKTPQLPTRSTKRKIIPKKRISV